jgi:hypothetical protein
VIDLLLATLGFTAIVAVALVALVGFTVVPFVVAVSMAERRAFSPARWGAVAVVSCLGGLGLAYLLWSHTGVPRPLALLPVVLSWAAPGVLWLLEGTEELIGGRSGRHE